MNMSDNSDTPRTNDRARMPTDCSPTWVVSVDFARTLERENTKLRAALENVFTHLGLEIHRKSLNESAADGTQALSIKVAEVLDATKP